MPIIECKKTKYITEILLFNLSFYKKEKYVSSTFYSFCGFVFYKIRELVGVRKKFFLGVKISEKSRNITNLFSQYNDFIYTSYHTGEFYYLCSIIKQNFESFKNIKIISCFKYLKQIMYILEFPEDWIEEHFVLSNVFIPSCLFFYDSSRKNLNLIETDYEKGFLYNKKFSQCHITKLLIQTFGMNHFKYEIPNNIHNVNNMNKNILIFPDSIFNGNLDFSFVAYLCQKLAYNGFKVYINTKNSDFDCLLTNKISKIYLSLNETYTFAARCNAIIGVRSGIFDCLQGLTNFNVHLYVIYNNYCFPSYNRMKNFKFFCETAYELKFCNPQFLHEYKWIKQDRNDATNIVNTVIEKLKEDICV